MATTVPDFGTYLLTSLMQDVSADILPDAQAVLAIVTTGGYQALLLPSNFLTQQAFLMKLQADALTAGNDLSKQIATYIGMWLTAKVASLAAAAATSVAAS